MIYDADTINDRSLILILLNLFLVLFSPPGPLDFSGKIPAHNSSSSSSSNHGNHNAVPIHPDVRLRNLPFYKVLGELLKPSSLGIVKF